MMLRNFSLKASALAIAVTTAMTTVLPAMASPSANGRYDGLIQTLTCYEDRDTYGDHNDYGYWDGGDWCGQSGAAGYWVYDYPNWYVWSYESAAVPAGEDSAYGKYSDLTQVLTCAADVDAYGDYYDYGYWGGGSWCGQSGAAGYWVYSYPSWYVWRTTN